MTQEFPEQCLASRPPLFKGLSPSLPQPQFLTLSPPHVIRFPFVLTGSAGQAKSSFSFFALSGFFGGVTSGLMCVLRLPCRSFVRKVVCLPGLPAILSIP